MKWNRIQLTEEEIVSLLEAERNVKKSQLLKRIQCIKLKNKGWKNLELAEFFVVEKHTITNWIKAYLGKGIEGLMEWNCVGRKSELTEEHQKILEDLLSDVEIKEQVQKKISNILDKWDD